MFDKTFIKSELNSNISTKTSIIKMSSTPVKIRQPRKENSSFNKGFLRHSNTNNLFVTNAKITEISHAKVVETAVGKSIKSKK